MDTILYFLLCFRGLFLQEVGLDTRLRNEILMRDQCARWVPMEMAQQDSLILMRSVRDCPRKGLGSDSY